MSKTVTGCIVTYNNIPTIDNAIRSLLSCTKISFKLYVVDNGSTDGTIEYIRDNFPEVNLIVLDKNLGFGKGHNTVLNLIDSDYHAIINPDIQIKDDVLDAMATYLDANPDIGMLSPEIRFFDGRPQILGKRIPRPKYLLASRLRSFSATKKTLEEYAMLDCDLSKPIDIQNATGCFMFIRTALFKELNGFDSRYFMYFEDCDLTREVALRTRAVYFPYATIYHEWGRESKRNIKLAVIHLQSLFKYYCKWGLKK